MSRHRTGRGALDVLDASNTNPVCPTCDYRTRAIAAVKTACDRCGEIFVIEGRAVALFVRAFRARVVLDGGEHADRTGA